MGLTGTAAIFMAPIEIITLIIEYLDLDETFNLGLTCHHFGHLLRSQRLSRIALQKAQYTLEYSEAHITGDYARGLRRLVKRRAAVRTARPYHVAIMAVANAFIYTNGALCYTFKQEDHEFLRILILRGCAVTEVQVDTRGLLLAALPDQAKHRSHKFKPLHYASGILSCLCTRSKHGISSSWLVLWHLESRQVIGVRALESARGIFVRNDQNHLYYGVREGQGRDGSRRWLIRGFHIQTQAWREKRVPEDLIGAEIGCTVCFEIIDGYFYALSTQATIDLGENKWNSFYYAFRFRCGEHSVLEVLPKSACWRRQATEGAIDNRWTSLSLTKDENSGELFIYESRKEWLSTHSQSQRTCYKKPLLFPNPGTDTLTNIETNSAGWDSETYSEVRRADYLHVGDDGSRGETLTFHSSLIRAYNPSCQSFIDLVNDTDPRTSSSCLRLRVRPNVRATFTRAKECCGPKDCPTGVSELSADEGVHYWPPRQEETTNRQLEQILGQYSPADSVDWAADERFLIYSPRGTNKNKNRALILISFDPGLRLHRLRKLYGGHAGDRHPCAALQNISLGDSTRVTKDTHHGNTTPSAEMNSDIDSQASRISPGPQYAATGSLIDSPCWGLATYATQSEPFYLSIVDQDGAPRGFDMTR